VTFLENHRFSRHCCMRQTKKCAKETEKKAHEFVTLVREKVEKPNRDQRYMINMDQMPVFYCRPLKVVWADVGIKNVTIKIAENAQKQVTVAVTVTASGHMLQSMIIYKGKPGATVEKSLPNMPYGAKYAVQDNSWMDECCMLLCLERLVKPYIVEYPIHIMPLLLLDSCRCHLMPSVVNAIKVLGVEIAHIPGGCTGFCQPVNVGIGYPLKNQLRNQFKNWQHERRQSHPNEIGQPKP
jgi:DDE superfamily endonuclease